MKLKRLDVVLRNSQLNMGDLTSQSLIRDAKFIFFYNILS